MNYKHKGFSLVELMIGIGLLSVLLASANVLLFTSLRTAKKAAAVGSAKAEGSYAINAMSRLIQYSDQIVQCDGSGNWVQVRRPNGDLVRYDYFQASGGNPGRIASSSAQLPLPNRSINLTSARVNVTKSSCGSVFSCNGNFIGICFAVGLFNTTDVNETGDALFNTQVVLRNTNN